MQSGREPSGRGRPRTAQGGSGRDGGGFRAAITSVTFAVRYQFPMVVVLTNSSAGSNDRSALVVQNPNHGFVQTIVVARAGGSPTAVGSARVGAIH